MSSAAARFERARNFVSEFVSLYRETWLGYLFVLPAIIMIAAVIIYPTIVGVYNGFLERSLLTPDQWQWIGLENYATAINDPIFVEAFFRSVILTVLAVSLQYLFGLGLALALKERVMGVSVFRSILLIPWVIPTVVMVTIFNFMIQPDYGLVNVVLERFGLPTRYWFGSPDHAFPIIVFLHVWRNVPFFAIALMAAMVAVPNELYEAAEMDGAGPVQRFRYITLPNISQISMIMIVLHVIYTFNNFDIVYLSTGGGPINSTEVLATYVYNQAFGQNALGYGSAVGTVMLVLMLVFTAVYVRLEDIE